MSSASAPIGIFDSGVGGLTVARTIAQLLPRESIDYIGDTAHGPYGPLPIAQVRSYAQDVADQLVDAGCKMLVIACNTATAAFLRDARERSDVPVLEVIHPAARRALATTRNRRIGVIATQGTVNSGEYQDLFSIAPGVEAWAVACPKFVEFVERGETSGPELMAVAEKYLAPLREAGIDTLVLGCTHYPLLSGVIQMIMGDDVRLVSSAEETTKDVYRVLTESGLHAPAGSAAVRSFSATGETADFDRVAAHILGFGPGEVNHSANVN